MLRVHAERERPMQAILTDMNQVSLGGNSTATSGRRFCCPDFRDTRSTERSHHHARRTHVARSVPCEIWHKPHHNIHAMTGSPATERSEDILKIETSLVRTGGCILQVDGEVDILTAPRLKAEIFGALDRGYSLVVIDLRGTTFLDASGIRELLAGLGESRRRKARLALFQPSAIVRRVLSVTGLDTLFTELDGEEARCIQRR